MTRPLLRAAGVSLSTLFALTALAPAAHAADPITEDPVEAAAGWLARQLADGDHMEVVFSGTTFPDAGLTADVVFALGASGVGHDYAANATTWLAANSGSYTGTDFGDAYAGAFAKLILVAETQGLDPTAFGGTDLVAALQAREQAGGRYSDLTSFDGDGDGSNDDFSNIITQALGILALERTGDGASANAVSTLVAEQCTDGGFPTFFVVSPDPCESDVDATGFAIQALVAAGADDEAELALDWLLSVQQADGSFQSGAPDLTSNSNSTGLALQVLLLAGAEDEATAAAEYILSLQVGCSGVAANRGAIGFEAAAVDDRAARASAGAIVGLAGALLFDVSEADGTDGAPVLDCPAPPVPPATDGDGETDPGASLPDTGTSSWTLVGTAAALALLGVAMMQAAGRTQLRHTRGAVRG